MIDDSHEIKFSDFFTKEENLLSILDLEDLPNKPLQSKFDVIVFCFYLLGISDEKTREKINNSRITYLFWEKCRELPKFKDSFCHFTDRDLSNTFKYVMYLNAVKSYNRILVIKMFFYLLHKNKIHEKMSLANIGKILSTKLSVFPKGNSSLRLTVLNKLVNSKEVDLVEKVKLSEIYNLEEKEQNLNQNLNLKPSKSKKSSKKLKERLVEVIAQFSNMKSSKSEPKLELNNSSEEDEVEEEVNNKANQIKANVRIKHSISQRLLMSKLKSEKKKNVNVNENSDNNKIKLENSAMIQNKQTQSSFINSNFTFPETKPSTESIIKNSLSSFLKHYSHNNYNMNEILKKEVINEFPIITETG